MRVSEDFFERIFFLDIHQSENDFLLEFGRLFIFGKFEFFLV